MPAPGECRAWTSSEHGTRGRRPWRRAGGSSTSEAYSWSRSSCAGSSLDHALECEPQCRDVGAVRLVFQRPQYAARDGDDVGVTAPARHREPIRYLHQVALRLVIGFDLAVSVQQFATVLAQLFERPASLMWRTLVIVRKVRCPAFAAIIPTPAHLMLAAD